MLDQNVPATPEGEGPRKGPPKAEEFCAPAPKVKRFSRKALALTSTLAVGVSALALSVGLQQPKLKPAPTPETVAKTPALGQAANALPTSYGDATGVPRLGPAGAGDVGV